MHQINEFFKYKALENQLTEWGTPIGQLGRLIPAFCIRKMQQSCLWVTDSKDHQIYPRFWQDLGLDLKQIFFLFEDDPFKNLRIPLKDSKFPIIVFDLKSYVSPSHMNYLAHYARSNKVTIFLLRKYFLSPRNGNPFAKFRFNCSYSLKTNRIKIQTVKGTPQCLNLTPQEVLYG